MTKKYSQIDMHDALYMGAREYPGGIVALAGRLLVPNADGDLKPMSANVLRNKLQPDIATHHPTYENVAEIIEKLDATKPAAADLIVDSFMWRLNRVAIRLPVGSDVDNDKLLSLMAELFSHDGRLADQIRKALDKDNLIDDAELARIEEAIQESSETLMTVRNEARQRHAADKAKAGKR